MAPTTIHRYLSGGRTPDLRNLMRLADFFDVSLDWLLGLSGERYNVMPRRFRMSQTSTKSLPPKTGE